MNTTRLRQARRLFTNELAERSQIRHNIRAWVRCLRAMGDKWVYAKTIRLSAE